LSWRNWYCDREMNMAPLLEALGYRESQKFVSPAKSDELPANELSFALRHTSQACQELTDRPQQCRFHGAYVLQEEAGSPAVPVVYVFETETDAAAKEIHRMVWNQNLVPFLIVASPSTIRVYPGFAYSRTEDKPLQSVPTSVAVGLDQLGQLAPFSATAIDDGTLWEDWGHTADPSQRVDESLLRDLKALDQRLQRGGLDRDASHGLIGKLVYLRYLRDRGILSDRKLAKWAIEPAAVFSRYATLKAFRTVNAGLQDWLNGSVFQLGDAALSVADVTEAQLQLVAGVFCGDSPDGQLHLDFSAYDFSHIPIETLSCVYEQFLHDTEDVGGQTRAEALGAYYTPIPLADYLISELERKRPLKEGMKVLDPACGSGVFLVQCYRRLVEAKMRAEKRPLNKEELRSLLTEHIFGIDRDDDACRVTELSLILTLLDYVSPPDLENTTFKLPSLREGNIFQNDFFDADGAWQSRLGKEQFDWVVGNPPWSEVKGQPAPGHDHYHAWKWMTAHKSSHPTGGNQIAEAFLWVVGDHLGATGVAGLLAPAMTWFKKESVEFRRQFFSQREVWCLANFANLAYVLFAGRAESPASAVFFKRTPPGDGHVILTFAPFVAEQVANRPQQANKRAVTWNIIVNGAEIREVTNDTAAAGSGLTWKLAMWGSTRDARLLERVDRNCPARFEHFCQNSGFTAHEGAHLVPFSPIRASYLEKRPDLAGKAKVDFAKLKGVGRIFSFPPVSMGRIHPDEVYVRKRGGYVGLGVSEPPHLVVDSSRRFAVFSEDFILVPKSQLGVKGLRGTEDRLRFLSLYLTSDFCTYHQFFLSPEWGVGRNIAYLETLNSLPIPDFTNSAPELAVWRDLHRSLVALSVKRFGPVGWLGDEESSFGALLAEMNNSMFKLLGLRRNERWLVEDFVHQNLQLNKGKVTEDSRAAPSNGDLRLYLTTLRDCLDNFLTSSRGLGHKIEAVTGRESALFSVSLQRTSAPVPPSVFAADQFEARALLALRDRLRRKHSQWVYFDRSLKVYDRGVLYQFKPMQRLHWTRRQAVLDADEIIAETLTEGGAS